MSLPVWLMLTPDSPPDRNQRIDELLQQQKYPDSRADTSAKVKKISKDFSLIWSLISVATIYYAIQESMLTGDGYAHLEDMEKTDVDNDESQGELVWEH